MKPLQNVLSVALLVISLSCNSAWGQRHWNEAMSLKFDGRKWAPGWSHQDDRGYMIEFVVPGQTVENWKELVTYQFYPGLQAKGNAEDFLNNFVARLRQHAPSVKVSIISKSKNSDDVMFEWKITDMPGLAQYELDRIVVGREGIHVLHYAIKSPNITAEQRSRWIEIFKANHVIASK